MADHRVDGVFFHKSIRETDDGVRRVREEVCHTVREAAEKNGRVFAIM